MGGQQDILLDVLGRSVAYCAKAFLLEITRAILVPLPSAPVDRTSI